MSHDMAKALPEPTQSHRKRVLGRLALSAVALLALARYNNVDWRSLPICGLPDTKLHMAPTPGEIDWKECGKGYECGRLEVPLDYHDSSAGTASVSVGRYLATSKPRLGSIFVNPGGSSVPLLGIVMCAHAVDLEFEAFDLGGVERLISISRRPRR